MEEDDPISKRSIFQFLLGRDTWQDLYKDFLKLQRDFFQAMDYRAWVTPEQCVEVCRGSAKGGGETGSRPGKSKDGLILLDSPHFPLRSRTRTHTTGSGAGCARAPLSFPGLGTICRVVEHGAVPEPGEWRA